MLRDEMRDHIEDDTRIPFEPEPYVAECFECGFELEEHHYVYVRGEHVFCSFCAPNNATEVLGSEL